jgi:hypothetical protein
LGEQLELNGVGGNLADGALRFMAAAVEDIDGVAFPEPQDMNCVVCLGGGKDELLQVRQIESVHRADGVESAAVIPVGIWQRNRYAREKSGLL